MAKTKARISYAVTDLIFNAIYLFIYLFDSLYISKFLPFWDVLIIAHVLSFLLGES